MSSWLYQGKPVSPELIEDHIGFCYQITNLVNGKKYIGKKLLKFTRTKKPLKGRTRNRKTVVPSDWETYYGSNKDLCADVERHGTDKFKREILRFCRSKSECNYWEAKLQFASDAIISENYYNDWISVKVHRNKTLDNRS